MNRSVTVEHRIKEMPQSSQKSIMEKRRKMRQEMLNNSKIKSDQAMEMLKILAKETF